MASISNDANGTRRLQFSFDGKRRSVRLGKMPKKQAEQFRQHVETIISSRNAKLPIPVETATWLGGLSDEFSDKLHEVGLIPKRTDAILGEFVSDYIQNEGSVCYATKCIWKQTERQLNTYFGTERPLRLIDHDGAKGYKDFLVAKGFRPYTIRKHVTTARQFLAEAVRKKYIASNPFDGIRAPAVIDLQTRPYVRRDDILKVMDAAPDAEWRALIALCRFGGLRCPSEVLSLRWDAIGWNSDRILVTSPKTAHFAGGDRRAIPFFPDLRQPLEEAFEAAPDNAEYVISRYRHLAVSPNGWRNANLRTSFLKIILRAHIVPWDRLFHSLRASCETDLMDNYPINVVTQWLGNTPAVALKHYALARKSHFDQASGGGPVASNPAPVPREESSAR